MTQTTSSTIRCLSAPSVGEGWTRREFLRGAAGVVALQAGVPASPQFAYVASGARSLHVFRMRGEAWAEIQHVPSHEPAYVLLSPDSQMLYVANDVEDHEGLPRGTVEAFHIDPLKGRLTSSGKIPLSLSATRPRHMALSPDGKLLAVAAYGGGVYNLLPVAKDGSLGQPCGIFKDAGCGPNTSEQGSAHPHTLTFDADGRHLLSSDFGSDRLNVFAVEGGRVSRRMQRSTGEGRSDPERGRRKSCRPGAGGASVRSYAIYDTAGTDGLVHRCGERSALAWAEGATRRGDMDRDWSRWREPLRAGWRERVDLASGGGPFDRGATQQDNRGTGKTTAKHGVQDNVELAR
jgi:hypothetical protein